MKPGSYTSSTRNRQQHNYTLVKAPHTFQTQVPGRMLIISGRYFLSLLEHKKQTRLRNTLGMPSAQRTTRQT